MSGSSTSGSQQSVGLQGLGTLNPLTAGLANLFGIGVKGSRLGGLTTDVPRDFEGILPQVFTPETFSSLGTLADPLNPLQFDLGELGALGQSILGTAGEAVDTGLFEPANELRRLLFEESQADIVERFGQQGLNPGDIDVTRALLREGNRGATELANLAQDRRLTAAQAAPSLAESIFNLESVGRGIERARTPGGQQLELLGALRGLGETGGSIGFNLGSNRTSTNSGGIK